MTDDVGQHIESAAVRPASGSTSLYRKPAKAADTTMHQLTARTNRWGLLKFKELKGKGLSMGNGRHLPKEWLAGNRVATVPDQFRLMLGAIRRYDMITKTDMHPA